MFYVIWTLPILQISLYLFIDFKKIKVEKKYIFLTIFLAYILIPFIVNYSSTNEKEKGCLLPVISMFGAIWIIGISFTTITHLIYLVYKKLKSIVLKRKPNG